MPKPRKVTDEQRARLRDIALRRRALETTKQLAYEMGVSKSCIEHIMLAELILHDEQARTAAAWAAAVVH